MREFRDKVAVITGAGSGIGLAAAHALARKGMAVVIAELREDRAREAEQAIVAAGGRALGLTCDVSVESDLIGLRDRTLAEFGRIDLLMNNAAVIFSAQFHELDISHWRRSYDVNLFSAVRAIQLMLPELRKSGDSHIVNVASAAALYPYNADRLAYNSSKSALLTLSEGLAMEYAADGIGVTCLCPGPTHTNIREQISFVGKAQAVVPPDLPFKTAEEIAETLLDAISRNRFFAPGNDEVFGIYARRGAAPDQFLHQATARLAECRKGQ